MKNMDELLSLFNDIQELPISEELLGAYLEGSLNASDSQKVETAFSNPSELNDFLSLVGQPTEQQILNVNDIEFNDIKASIGVEVLTDLNLALYAINKDFPSGEKELNSNSGDIKQGQTPSFMTDNDNSQASMKESKTFGYEPNKAENKYDPLIDQGAHPSCAIKSQEIVLRDYGIAIPQEELIAYASQQGWYSDDLENGGTPRDAVGNLLEACGIPTMRTENATIYDIIAELRAGHRVIVSVDADELWIKKEPTLFKRLFGEFKNNVQDAVDKLNGVQGANHALIVAGVTVNPKDPSDMHVTLIDSGSGDVCIEYSLKDFQNALEDSNCYMVSTTVPAPYQYNYETHEMEPSSFNTCYYPSKATMPIGLSNEFHLDEGFYEKYAGHEPVYDVITAHCNDSDEEVYSSDDNDVQQREETSGNDVNMASYADDDSLDNDDENIMGKISDDDDISGHNNIIDDTDEDNVGSVGADFDNHSDDVGYDN